MKFSALACLACWPTSRVSRIRGPLNAQVSDQARRQAGSLNPRCDEMIRCDSRRARLTYSLRRRARVDVDVYVRIGMSSVSM